MRIFFYLILLFAARAPLFAAVLPQDNYQRFTFAEDGSGFYVKSYYDRRLDKVRFDSCERGNQCQTIAELSYTKLKQLEGPTLEMLRKLRAEVDQNKNTFWLFFSRAGAKSRDVEAIDELIKEIEKEGLGHLVLLTNENIGREPPKFTTPKFARELVARMKAVLESSAPMGDVDCIPYLRQQGL